MATEDTRPADRAAPIGRSLHIGVNVLDPTKYLFYAYTGNKDQVFKQNGDSLTAIENPCVIGWRGTLGEKGKACELDAENLANIARDRGFEPKILLSDQATVKNVRDEIERAGKDLYAGDVFLVTFSGHGCHVQDTNDDEPDKYDETWCLYDRMLIDDEQRVMYSNFRPGVRIVALLDSCHSGTGARAKPPEPHDTLEARGADDTIYKYGKNKEFYDNIQNELGDLPEPNPNVITLAACQDTQRAWGNAKGGIFTNTVRKLIADGGFAGNYFQLHEQILKNIPRDTKARQDPRVDHKLPAALEDAIAEHPDDDALIERVLAEEIEKDLEHEQALRNLVAFIRDTPFSIPAGFDDRGKGTGDPRAP